MAKGFRLSICQSTKAGKTEQNKTAAFLGESSGWVFGK
jgi:hypothetical protein